MKHGYNLLSIISSYLSGKFGGVSRVLIDHTQEFAEQIHKDLYPIWALVNRPQVEDCAEKSCPSCLIYSGKNGGVCETLKTHCFFSAPS